jgi:tetratricopeptide (TPR) repeat protein
MCLCCIELGLRSRNLWTEHSSELSVESLKSKGEIAQRTFVFFGDSVAGWDETSLASRLERALNLDPTKTQGVRFLNLSKPALRTSEVLEGLDRVLNITEPFAVLLLAGKADFRSQTLINRQDSALKIWTLIELNIDKLLGSAKRRWLLTQTELLKLGFLSVSTVPLPVLQHSWLTQNENSQICIEYGEQLVLRMQKEEPSMSPDILKTLFQCYLRTEQPEKALAFFEALRSIAPKDETLAGLVASLLTGAGRLAEANRILESFDSSNKIIEISRYRIKNASGEDPQKNELSQFFGNLSKSSRYPEKESTRQNLRKIHTLLQERGIHLVILQYPTEDIKNLENVFQGVNRTGLSLFDTNMIFSKASESSSLHNYFKEDWEHLTEQGREKIIPTLSEYIKRHIL